MARRARQPHVGRRCEGVPGRVPLNERAVDVLQHEEHVAHQHPLRRLVRAAGRRAAAARTPGAVGQRRGARLARCDVRLGSRYVGVLQRWHRRRQRRLARQQRCARAARHGHMRSRVHQRTEQLQRGRQVPHALPVVEPPDRLGECQRIRRATRLHQPPPGDLSTLALRHKTARDAAVKDAHGVAEEPRGRLAIVRKLWHLQLDEVLQLVGDVHGPIMWVHGAWRVCRARETDSSRAAGGTSGRWCYPMGAKRGTERQGRPGCRSTRSRRG